MVKTNLYKKYYLSSMTLPRHNLIKLLLSMTSYSPPPFDACHQSKSVNKLVLSRFHVAAVFERFFSFPDKRSREINKISWPAFNFAMILIFAK